MSTPRFTPTELEVGECRAKGWNCNRIGEWLGMSPKTVQGHINRMALKIRDMEDFTPGDRVLVYFAHQKWAKQHDAHKVA